MEYGIVRTPEHRGRIVSLSFNNAFEVSGELSSCSMLACRYEVHKSWGLDPLMYTALSAQCTLHSVSATGWASVTPYKCTSSRAY